MTYIEPDEIIETKKCPFCGYKNDPDYVGSHVVNYSCYICGLKTSFIDPRNGFELSELPDGLGEDEFMDAVEEAEKEDLENYGLEQHIPDENCKKGITVLSRFRKINEPMFIDITAFDGAELFRVSESQSVKILIIRIFEEL